MTPFMGARFDPHPNLMDLIRLHHEADAANPARPIRLHRAVAMPAGKWRFVSERNHRLSDGPLARNTERRRNLRIASWGESMGLSVGSVVETVEVTP